MSYSDLLHNLRFERDPFAKTNADEEELLENYFIEPPFFKAVYGDISDPKSAVVYAPRGGGKTALKRRIELSARTDRFLSVTYNSFPTSGLKIKDVTLEYHLRNIVRILLVAILSEATTTGVDRLTRDQRHFLYVLSKEHLSQLSRADLKEAISAVTHISDRAKEVWNKLTGPISAGLTAVLSHWGFKAPEISKFDNDNAKAGSLEEQIRFLVDIVPAFEFSSVYVLVDKIDENPLTGGASSSLAFIRPLLSDLGILETKGMALKLFLWDRIEPDALQFSRPDRIKTYRLQWSAPQLKEMLSRRLSAHSTGKVSSLASIVTLGREADIDDLIVSLSGGSPRNIIRICKAIFDQQSEAGAQSHVVSEKAVLAGIEDIAAAIAAETVPENVLRDLKKLKHADFTLTNVYADVFRISQGAGTQKVQSWQDAGAVIKIGNRQEKRGNRPSNVYAVTSPIVLKHIFSELNALDFTEKKMRRCECGQLVLRDWDSSRNQSCHVCEHIFGEDTGSPSGSAHGHT
jgi:hypothetical protein